MTVQPVAGYEELIHNGVKLFHPTKEIVFGHKRFASWPEVSDEQYIAAYRKIIEANMPQIKEWYSSLHGEQINICCYCPRDKFCHRQFVARTLTWLNKKMSLAHIIELF